MQKDNKKRSKAMITKKLDGESDEENNSDLDEDRVQAKKIKQGESDFLEVGSVSWSILIALYFLTLHDDHSDSCITFESIQEILEVLKHEFGDMLPLVNNLEELIKLGPYEL
jgi:hypothetical protein